ncbi:hypothetical protein AX14_006303 [Amanita brunnescens Koide BX004]|nr:hypothetical protein AX14_006303 [Amanita brunnescens Koide BX004]
MSTVSSSKGAPDDKASVVSLTLAQLNKAVGSFCACGKAIPEGSPTEVNAPLFRRWCEQAQTDVERIADYSEELRDLGHPQKLAHVVREGLEQYKALVTWLKELDASTGTQIARTGSGTSLRPEDSASRLGGGSVVRSVLESGPHVDLKTRTLVVDSTRSMGSSRGATHKTHSAMGEMLMAVGQRCERCAASGKQCTVGSSNRQLCNQCRNDRKGCSLNTETKGRPKGEAKGGSITSALVGRVVDMEVSSGMSTPSRSDKRKAQEVGSSLENQPARRWSKVVIKVEAGELLQVAIVRGTSTPALEEQVKDLYTFFNKSVENLRGQIDAVCAEAEGAGGPSSKQVGPSEAPVPKGRGDEVPFGEGELLNHVSEAPLKLSGSGKAGLVDFILDAAQIGRPFLKLAGAVDHQWHCRLDSMCNKEGAVSSGRVDCYAFSPEDRRHDLAPLASVAVGGVNERFTHIKMSLLHDAVSLGVVGRDANMIDAILMSQNVEHGESTSSKMNLVIPNAFSERSMQYSGHAESEHYDPEKAAQLGHGRRDMEAVHVTGLADVTGADEPFDIVIKGRPPKPVVDAGSGCKYTFMASVIVRFSDDSYVPFVIENDQLVSPMAVAIPELIPLHEEALDFG